MEIPTPYYLLWPIALLTNGKFALLGAGIFFFQTLVFMPYLLLMGSLISLLYASASRKQVSVTGLTLGAIALLLLLLVLTGQYSLLLSEPIWWFLHIAGPAALVMWVEMKRRKMGRLETRVTLLAVGSVLTYLLTLPFLLGLILR